VRANQHILSVQKGVICLRRLLLENIQSGTRDSAVIQGRNQRLFIDEWPSGRINNDRVIGHFGEGFGAEGVMGLLVVWSVQGQIV
jgi:hypothetical protein